MIVGSRILPAAATVVAIANIAALVKIFLLIVSIASSIAS